MDISEKSSANGMHFNIFYVINEVEKSIKLGSKLALYWPYKEEC